MRVFFCLFALLCSLSANAFAGTSGMSGEWVYYGNLEGKVCIDEESGVLEDGTISTSYVLLEGQGANQRRATKKGSSHPGGVREVQRIHEDIVLFLGVKNPILVREGARFTAPREKIRGRWHYAAQMNETFYYDVEFDLDAWEMVEITRSASGGETRSAGRPLEKLLDAQMELAVRSGGAVYHFTRLGADFLVLEPSYAKSILNGYKILMERTQATRQASTEAGLAKASEAEAHGEKSNQDRDTKQRKP